MGSKKDRFLKIDHYIFKRDAWKSLKPTEIRVWLLLAERYNGGNNGRIALSIRDAASLGKMSKETARRALETLVSRGFVKLRYKGSFSQKLRRASEYELTNFKYGNKPATKDFTRWKSDKSTGPNKVHERLKLDKMSNENVI